MFAKTNGEVITGVQIEPDLNEQVSIFFEILV